ncbi:MAG TPA: hypothetical protein VJS64_01045 [Pyrinomonadaceae bacterium]|nr:hypothetical protein [Pyrinomonadaceae bacterium]
MSSFQWQLTRFFVVLALVGLPIFSSNALAQDARETLTYSPATVTVTADRTRIEACGTDAALVQLAANAVSPSGKPIRYAWRVSNGRIEGEGANVVWNLAGAGAGQHKAYLVTTSGTDNELCEASATTVVEVRCVTRAKVTCPSVGIICPEQIAVGQPVTFTSSLTGGSGNVPAIYNWTISSGKIISGQGTNSITVDTTGMEGRALSASLSMAGYEDECLATCMIQFPALIAGRKFDQFPDIARNDEKARLDNFTIGLQNDPTATGYVIVYPGKKDRAGTAQKRASRISDYVVNSRGLDARRIVTLVGSQKDDFRIELWIRPQGAPAPSF